MHMSMDFGRRRVASLAVVVAALAVTTVMATSTARAEDPFGGHLPGKTWTTNGVFDSSLHYIKGEVTAGPNAICVAPAQFSGSWSFPYGWECSATGRVTWEFASISAYPAVDNPNSKEISYTVLYF